MTVIAPEYSSQLETFQNLLLKWNARINLISKNTEHEIWHRHILDSAQLDKYIPRGTETLADFGTGAGFPGLIIAIMRPEISVHLIESDARKCAFLVEAKTQLNLNNVTIHNERTENITGLKPDIITARAFSELKIFLKSAMHFQKIECLNILLKGSNLNSEIENAKNFYDFKIKTHQSITDASGKIAIITDIKKHEKQSIMPNDSHS